MTKIFLEEINSTNDYAKQHIECFSDKTVIYTNTQTNGHGRLGNSWLGFSNNKYHNLYMSLILKPPKKFAKILPNLTQYVSVIICNLLKEYNANAVIKWPNDILINNKKIAGILAEKTSATDGVVIGIGINLNLTIKDIEKIDKPATSLNIETGNDIDRDEFLNRFYILFKKDYNNFLKRGFSFIEQEYKSKVIFIGQEISVAINKKERITGIAKGINPSGALLLQTRKGEETVLSGEIV